MSLLLTATSCKIQRQHVENEFDLCWIPLLRFSYATAHKCALTMALWLNAVVWILNLFGLVTAIYFSFRSYSDPIL